MKTTDGLALQPTIRVVGVGQDAVNQPSTVATWSCNARVDILHACSYFHACARRSGWCRGGDDQCCFSSPLSISTRGDEIDHARGLRFQNRGLNAWPWIHPHAQRNGVFATAHTHTHKPSTEERSSFTRSTKRELTWPRGCCCGCTQQPYIMVQCTALLSQR